MKRPDVPTILVTATAMRAVEAESFSLATHLEYCPSDHLPVPGKALIYLLNFGVERIELLSWTKKAQSPLYVDFASSKNSYRRRYSTARNELLAKAIGLKTGVSSLRVVDTTAGLGRDAMVLANLGCSVQMFERNPIVFQLLEDGLRRARLSTDQQLLELMTRMELSYGQALMSGEPDVIYLDPMFPLKNKSSLASKEMAIFQHLVGDDGDADQLLQQALESNAKRVVVKRHRLAPLLAACKPSHQIVGSSSRFDVYTKKKLGHAG